jgi:tRNA nucleotidyltransferase/poly(A) polymerase
MENIVNTLAKHNKKCFLVGGAVRDYLQNKKVADLDFATDATPRELKTFFSGNKIVCAGEQFNVTIINGFEVATFRTDHYQGSNQHNCDIKYADNIFDDLARRDLTINAMAINMHGDGDLIDPYNGLKDLEKKVIRFVGNPYMRIHEDPNRIIRAVRFCSSINGELESATKKAIQDSVKNGTYALIAPERVRLEIVKAMQTKRASKFFETLHQVGLLKKIFPSLDSCYNHDGGPYHKEDVFTHNMLAGDYVSPRFWDTKLAAYLHDVGKPAVFDRKEKTFHGHEVVGASIAEKELRKLKFSNDEIEKITTLIRLHMRFFSTPKAIKRIFVELNNSKAGYKDLLRVKYGDRQGNLNKPDWTFSQIKDKLIHVETIMNDKKSSAFSIKDLEISGNDVMNIFEIDPGKQVGDTLKDIFTRVNDGELKNDREELLNELEVLKTMSAEKKMAI